MKSLCQQNLCQQQVCIAVATRRIAVATIVALVDGSFSRLDNQVAARIGAVVEVERNPAGDSGI